MRKPSSVTTDLVNYNPFLYRGYVYDSDSGLYSLQSRYYDPTTGRFLNADDTAYIGYSATTLSTNLFAYCENNFIKYIDVTGKGLLELLIYGIAVKCFVSSILRSYNYEHNSSYIFSNYINGQAIGNAAKVRMGLYTGDYNGCGWIAVYNALRVLKCYTIQPRNIISYFEAYQLILYGIFGVMPWAIRDYFYHVGYVNVKYETNPKMINGTLDFTRKLKNTYRVCVLMFWHGKGAHYIAVTYSSSIKQYYIYNLYNNVTSCKTTKDLDKFLTKDKGYRYLAVIFVK